MGSALIPFDAPNLPAYVTARAEGSSINKDVIRNAAYPTLSIKGKVFTLKKDGMKKLLTKPGGEPDEVAQYIGVVILRSNLAGSNYYSKEFNDGDSDGQVPDCYTHDGITPSQHASNPQATKCAICPHRVWGSRISRDAKPGEEKKGRACSDQGRLAIATADKLEEPMLLRVPPASLKNYRDAVKLLDARKLDYNMVVMRIGFVAEAASPQLTFKPVAILPDAEYATANAQYDAELTRLVVGVDDDGGAPATKAADESPVSADELDAALAARDAAGKAAQAAAATPAPAPAPKATARTPKPAPAPAPVVEAPAPAPAPVAASPVPAEPAAAGGFLDDLDALLGKSDD